MLAEGRTYPARWTARGCQVDVSYVYTRQYTRQYTRHSRAAAEASRPAPIRWGAQHGEKWVLADFQFFDK